MWPLSPAAKRSQHVNATYRNIVGRNMLCAFGYRVAMCCDILGVVRSHRNTVAKRSQHVAPNNVGICSVDMLRSFGRGFRLKRDRRMTAPTYFSNSCNLSKILIIHDKHIFFWINLKISTSVVNKRSATKKRNWKF